MDKDIHKQRNKRIYFVLTLELMGSPKYLPMPIDTITSSFLHNFDEIISIFQDQK